MSKRIPHMPRRIKLGHSVIHLAHPKAVSGDRLGVFAAFIPQAIEMLVWESEATSEKLDVLEKRGIRAVIVPDVDVDHL